MDHRSRARHVSRRDFLALTGVAAGALGGTRLGRAATLAAPIAQATPGGTLVVGHIGDVDNYDPLTDALDQFQNYGRLLIFSNLTAYDAGSALVGDLATEWELDGTSWVFKLRDGVTWHDGSPFTADDQSQPSLDQCLLSRPDDRGFDREEGFRGRESGSANWHGSVQIRELVTE